MIKRSETTHHHRIVVAPRQKQVARIVLLPVRQEKARKHIPQAEVHPPRGNAEVTPPEDGVKASRDENRRPRVQPVVEQLAQGTARFRSPCLLPVNAIFINKRWGKR